MTSVSDWLNGRSESQTAKNVLITVLTDPQRGFNMDDDFSAIAGCGDDELTTWCNNGNVIPSLRGALISKAREYRAQQAQQGGGQGGIGIQDVYEELQSIKLDRQMQIFHSLRRYKSGKLRASEQTAEVRKFCNIAQQYLNCKVVERKELLKLPERFKLTVRKNPFDKFAWAEQKDDKTGKMIQLRENDPKNVEAYKKSWQLQLFGLVGNEGVVYEVQKDKDNRKMFGQDFTIDSDNSLEYLGFYPEEGAVAILDLLLASKPTVNKNSINKPKPKIVNDPCADIVCGIELKPLGKSLRPLQSELQLMIMDIVFFQHGNKRDPLIFQTQMSDENKGSKCVAFYFEENEHYRSHRGGAVMEEETGENESKYDNNTEFFLVEQPISSQYMLEWIKYLYNQEEDLNDKNKDDINISGSEPNSTENPFPKLISLQNTRSNAPTAQ